MDPNNPNTDRALLPHTIRTTAPLPATLKGEKKFIAEGLTEGVITLATNTLAAVTDTPNDTVGHPMELENRIQEKEDTLAPELMDHLAQLTSQPEQHVLRIVLKVTDWTVLDSTPGTTMVALMCH